MSDLPLRVLYSFPHALDWPGIATTALHEIRGLAGRGMQVELYCTSVGAAALPASVRVVETMTIGGRRIPHRVIGVQRTYSRHDRIVARRLRNGPRPDVVHAWPRGCVQTFSVARQLGVLGVRECPNPHTASVYRESARAAADAGVPLSTGHSHAASGSVLELENREFDTAGALLVPSQYAADRYVEEGLPAVKILRHRYGSDTDRFYADPVERDPDAPLRGCFLGRGDPTKGLHLALRAWLTADLPDGSVLTVAGTVDPAYGRRLATELSDPRVRLAGFVADTPQLLRSSDVLLLPTWTEGSALVIYEAQASGCLPLVSDASGAFGETGSDFLTHPVGDVSTLAGQLSLLASEPGRLRELREGLLSRRHTFSWEAAAETVEACYRFALSAPPR